VTPVDHWRGILLEVEAELGARVMRVVFASGAPVLRHAAAALYLRAWDDWLTLRRQLRLDLEDSAEWAFSRCLLLHLASIDTALNDALFVAELVELLVPAGEHGEDLVVAPDV